jgi:hypothetical protein
VEDLVSAFPSSFVLTTLLGMHPLLWFLWVAYRLQQTYEAHSGWVSLSAWLLWLLSLLMSQLMVVLLALVSQWPLLWLLSQLLVLVKSCVTSRKGEQSVCPKRRPARASCPLCQVLSSSLASCHAGTSSR